jgi:hydroxymethylbilane synthase
MQTLKVASRKSRLALWQAQWVCEKLELAGFSTQIMGIETKGDKILNRSIAKIGSKGVFTEELEQMLSDGSADLAIHSAKDLQTTLPEGLDIIAFTQREKVCDVLVSFNHSARLSNSADFTVATSSVRRVATVRRHFPKCRTKDIRGNLHTRIEKLEEGICDGLILAYAGVARMGFEHLIAEELSLDIFTPAVGQGSIAIQASSHLQNHLRLEIQKAVNHEETEFCIKAERSFLFHINGGCSVPAFALANVEGGRIFMRAGIISPDGKQEVRAELTGGVGDYFDLGKELAHKILGDGGKEILEKI